MKNLIQTFLACVLYLCSVNMSFAKIEVQIPRTSFEQKGKKQIWLASDNLGVFCENVDQAMGFGYRLTKKISEQKAIEQLAESNGGRKVCNFIQNESFARVSTSIHIFLNNSRLFLTLYFSQKYGYRITAYPIY